jgi:hypothetical protein
MRSNGLAFFFLGVSLAGLACDSSKGDSAQCDFRETDDPALIAPYDYDADAVLGLAEGKWAGNLDGEPFEVVVTRNSWNPLYGFHFSLEDGAEPVLGNEDSCSLLVVPVDVATDGAFAGLVGNDLQVEGVSLATDEADVTPTRNGHVTLQLEPDGAGEDASAGGVRVLLFASDGSLWSIGNATTVKVGKRAQDG